MVLFSLILALGMLVDNAIVVIENIYRHREEGYSLIEAAKVGTSEVALPIITSTITTLVAFSPLLFWSGIIGEFMKLLPMTLIITLASSLFVGLVINPVLASRFVKVEKKKLKGEDFFNWLIQRYDVTLNWAINHPGADAVFCNWVICRRVFSVGRTVQYRRRIFSRNRTAADSRGCGYQGWHPY
jgi:multidrug efflux pump